MRTLTLRLIDVDLTPLLNHGSIREGNSTSVLSLYERELLRLKQALDAVPNLSRLTIVAPKASRSELLKGLYWSFLHSIPERCPKLRELQVHDSSDILETVPALKQIPCVTFTEQASKASKDDPRDSGTGAGKEVDAKKANSKRVSSTLKC